MDLAIVEWAYQLHSPVLDRIMLTVTSLSDLGLIWIVLAIPLLINKKTRPWGIAYAVSMALTFLFGNIILKNLIARPRPYTLLPEIVLLLSEPHDWSFPSGHTSISFTAALSIWFWNRKLGTGLLGVAVMIAFSRLYLSVHYPTDLLAGALLGVVCALFAHWLVGRKYNLKQS